MKKKKNREWETEGNKLSKNFTIKNKKQRKFSSDDENGKVDEQSEYLSEFLFPSGLLLLLVTKVKRNCLRKKT